MAREDVKIQLLNAISFLDNRDLLAHHLPIGRLWNGAFDPETNIGKLLLGLCGEYYRLGLLTENIQIEADIDQTLELLENWERSMGIPNSLFLNTEDLETRRTNVKYLLGNFGGVQTAADFERVASYFGFTVEVHPGVYYASFPLTFPILLLDKEKTARYTIIVSTGQIIGDEYFPVEFPIPFGSGVTTFLENLFTLLAPANCFVIVTNNYLGL